MRPDYKKRVLQVLCWVFLYGISQISWAQTVFSNLDEYLNHIAFGRDRVSNELPAESGKFLFGAVEWRKKSDRNLDRSVTVFVLEKLSNGTLREVDRSMSELMLGDRQATDGFETNGDKKFSLRIHNFIPLGTNYYHFAYRNKLWLLVGRDEDMCCLHLEDGDEAQCDSRTSESTNYLTGKIISEKYRNNKLVTKSAKYKKFPKLTLTKFEFGIE